MHLLPAIVLAAAASGIAPIDAPSVPDDRPDPTALVHSELQYLDVRDKKIALEVEKAAPEDVLGKIALKGGFRWSIHGTLPQTPRLTGMFRETTVRQALEWLAEKTGVLYRVKGPLELEVYPPGDSEK